ncbi:hypothetical protein CHCC15381_1272 [Bacillus paralicheniformis]|uniref:Histidine kinase/HSP90-like ATPase domain-containing protein n=2 Tax=Bacillus paralicheniformis TaxID=1648923 RepID=A0ABY3FVC8_9BACI|nr:hypothetical protein CHCC15381_1272 [Bacillus paralicheniformis]
MDLPTQLIGGMLETFLIITIGISLLNVSYKNKFFCLLLISLYGSIVLYLVKSSFPPLLYLSIMVLAISLPVSLFLNLRILLSIIGVLLGAVCLLVSEVIGFAMLRVAEPVLNVKEGSLGTALPHFCILLFMLFLIRKKRVVLISPKKQVKDLDIKLYMILILSFSLLLLYYFIIYKNQKVEGFINLFWSIALVSLTFFTLIIMRRIFYKNLRNAENSLEEQYEEVGKYIHFIKKHNHDQGHHLIAIQQMLNKGQYEETKHYLSDVMKDSALISDILPIHSIALSALLLSYKDKALKEDIRIHYKISDSLRDFPCKLFETNKIFGNLIMNAVEAVKELGDIPERTVYVQIDSGEGYYRIDVGNFGDVERFAEVVDRIFEEGFSTKGKKGRGYGLHIVKSVVEKHQGFIFPEIIDRMIVFKVRIPKELGDG